MSTFQKIIFVALCGAFLLVGQWLSSSFATSVTAQNAPQSTAYDTLTCRLLGITNNTPDGFAALLGMTNGGNVATVFSNQNTQLVQVGTMQGAGWLNTMNNNQVPQAIIATRPDSTGALITMNNQGTMGALIGAFYRGGSAQVFGNDGKVHASMSVFSLPEEKETLVGVLNLFADDVRGRVVVSSRKYGGEVSVSDGEKLSRLAGLYTTAAGGRVEANSKKSQGCAMMESFAFGLGSGLVGIYGEEGMFRGLMFADAGGGVINVKGPSSKKDWSIDGKELANVWMSVGGNEGKVRVHGINGGGLTRFP